MGTETVHCSIQDDGAYMYVEEMCNSVNDFVLRLNTYFPPEIHLYISFLLTVKSVYHRR